VVELTTSHGAGEQDLRRCITGLLTCCREARSVGTCLGAGPGRLPHYKGLARLQFMKTRRRYFRAGSLVDQDTRQPGSDQLFLILYTQVVQDPALMRGRFEATEMTSYHPANGCNAPCRDAEQGPENTILHGPDQPGGD